MVGSLRVRNYRLFFFGQVVSVSGTWMQTVAQSFLVLQLTGSGAQLGLATAARFAPLFLLGVWGGLIADRFDKRRILYLTQTLAALLALAFAVLIATGTITMPIVYVLATALGLVNVFDNPARQTLISELVPADDLRNAVTLNSVTINIARLVGGGAGGAIASLLGLALCFGLNALSFVAVVISLVAMSGADIARSEPVPRQRGQIVDALRYVARTPALVAPLTMITIVGILAWEFEVSIPLIAQRTFHGDAGTYGTMTAVMGLGAVLGGLYEASRTRRTRGVSLSVIAIGWGITIVAASLAPTLLIEYVVLFAVGVGSIMFNALAKTTLQLTSTPEMRGRVMALWALAWQGTTPIGGPVIGWIAEVAGARWGLLVGGLATLLVGFVAYPVLRRLDRRGLSGQKQ